MTTDAYARFLTARWDEIEQAAESARYFYPSSEHDGMDESPWPDAEEWEDYAGRNEAQHLAAQSPTYVLADLAAKRAILNLHRIGLDPCDAHDGVTMLSVECDTVCLLAEPFRHHPDHPASQEQT